MADIVFRLAAFILGLMLILYGVDKFVDNVRGMVERKNISPYIIGALLLGVDIEELVASIVAAIKGYPIVAVGNAIGNNTIALTLPIAIPAFVMVYQVKKVPKPFLIAVGMQVFLIVISVAFLACAGWNLVVIGIGCLAIYVSLIAYNISFVRKRLALDDGNNISEIVLDHVIIDDDGGDKKVDDIQPSDSDRQGCKKKTSIIIIFACTMIIAGAWLFGEGIEGFVNGLGFSEHVLGYVIVALGVNVEEFIIAFKSARCKIPELGFGSIVMKTSWNLGLTYGLSVIIHGDVPFVSSLAWNAILLAIAFTSLVFILHYQKMSPTRAIYLTFVFIVVMVVNLALVHA